MTSLLYLILLRPTVHVPVACAEVLNARTARVELVCYDRRIEWTRKNQDVQKCDEWLEAWEREH